MSDNMKRQPAGIPVGGQFAANDHDEAASSLSQSSDTDTVTILRDHFGDAKTVSAIVSEYGVENTTEAIAEWAAENGHTVESEERIILGEDPVDMDELTSAYRSNGEHGLSEIYVSPHASSGSDNDAAVVVRMNDNVLWSDEFTSAELDAHYPVVEDAYKEWFGADIELTDGWDSLSVEMSKDVPRADLSESTVNEAAWGITAKWSNETDPGTFNSPYFGTFLRQKIDNSRVIDRSAEYQPVPSDLSKEDISDAEAVSIGAELRTSLFEAGSDIDTSSLEKFASRGVLTISDADEMVSTIRYSKNKNIEAGVMTLRRARRVEELSDALERWMHNKPEYPSEDD